MFGGDVEAADHDVHDEGNNRQLGLEVEMVRVGAPVPILAGEPLDDMHYLEEEDLYDPDELPNTPEQDHDVQVPPGGDEGGTGDGPDQDVDDDPDFDDENLDLYENPNLYNDPPNQDINDDRGRDQGSADEAADQDVDNDAANQDVDEDLDLDEDVDGGNAGIYLFIIKLNIY